MTKKGIKEKKNNTFFTNGELWTAMPAMQQLMNQRLHVRVSMELAKLVQKLKPGIEAIEEVRKGLVKKYEEDDKETGRKMIKPNSKNMDEFLVEWAEALKGDSDLKRNITKVKIPDQVGGSCPKCKKNIMEPLVMEGTTIMSLMEFIEVVEAK